MLADAATGATASSHTGVSHTRYRKPRLYTIIARITGSVSSGAGLRGVASPMARVSHSGMVAFRDDEGPHQSVRALQFMFIGFFLALI